ncbi:type II toxin-antitoxin system RelE/ParE family toxin [Rhodobacteraceae bacterium ASV31]|nr:type II toxin-antitoxin system RelE/ParE family toxin [Anianabacter salinae]
MILKLGFTPRAEARLRDIARHTLETFGAHQAQKYEALLIERCAMLASGRVPSRSCSSITRDTSDTDLLYARAGEHFLIHAIEDDEVTIIDILHTRSDLPRWIAAIDAMGGA